ncbi:MAG: hypothetical protein QOG36_890 [Actinomycetota bacterium]|jgi:hypothetical protein|nr:hypothetical protein [Actinomycetota bacterium]
MTTPATTEADTDPVRAAILTAIDRLVEGTPHRSEGRLSVSQLAVEADVKRWHLTKVLPMRRPGAHLVNPAPLVLVDGHNRCGWPPASPRRSPAATAAET